MRFWTIALSAALLAACGNGTSDTSNEESAGAGDVAAVETVEAAEAEGRFAALTACEAVAKLGEGMNPDAPFEGLSWASTRENAFPDELETDMQPWGTVCKHGILTGWNEGDPDSHVFRCNIFEASSLRFEEEKPNAEAAFKEAKETLDKCLPDGWTARVDDGQLNGEEAETYIYERASDIERRESSNFYMYPILLRKAFFRSPESRGGPWGWIVDVAFQQEEARTDAASGQE